VVAEALRFGSATDARQVWREFGAAEMIVRKVEGRTLCTSLDVLAEEISSFNFVRSGRAPARRSKAARP